MEDYTPHSQKPLIVRGAVVAVLVLFIAGVAAKARQGGDDDAVVSVEVPTATAAVVRTPVATVSSSPSASASVSATASATPIPTATSTVAPSTAYADGTYTATGSYASPSGLESIDVQLTIANDIVKSATVTANAFGGDSAEYQQRFISGYKSQVVGKSVDSISLTRVSGASLTTRGFNSALSAIKSQAKS